jgi:hypothetical protein
MAYIDTELARRLGTGSTAAKEQEEIMKAKSTERKEVERQPTTVGKLIEIDLGAEARQRNAEMTERARRKLEGEEEIIEEKRKKVRLGRDGKPWRGRKRRNSEDIKRDKLVEDVLRENRRELFHTHTVVYC